MASFLNPDGSIRVQRKGAASDLREDLFQTAVRGSWWGLLGAFLAAYLLTAGGFALLYLLRPGCLAGLGEGGSLLVYFYSCLALAGAGHEVVHPVGAYGHALVVAESLLGLFGFALFTGLFFSRFSRSPARVRFTSRFLRTRYEGRRALVFRVANERDVPVIDPRAELWLVRTVTTPEGLKVRRPEALPLAMPRIAVLVLSWNLVHYLDEPGSVDEEELASMLGGPADLYLMVTGLDAVTGSPVHVYQSYDAGDVHEGGRFREMVAYNEDGSRTIDFDLLDAVEPLPEPPPPPAEAPGAPGEDLQ